MAKQKPLTFDERGFPDCGKCLMYQLESPYLWEACASVGIEHGKSAGQMVREVLRSYHQRRHTEGDRP